MEKKEDNLERDRRKLHEIEEEEAEEMQEEEEEDKDGCWPFASVKRTYYWGYPSTAEIWNPFFSITGPIKGQLARQGPDV